MKRAIGAVLAAVILMVSCLSGYGGGGWEKWDPSSLPHNSNLKLSDSRNQFLAADQVELIDGYEDQEDQSYTSADGYKVRVCLLYTSLTVEAAVSIRMTGIPCWASFNRASALTVGICSDRTMTA